MVNALEEIAAVGEEKAKALEARVEQIRLASKDAIADTRTITAVATRDLSVGLRNLAEGIDSVPLTDRVALSAPNGLRIMISDVAHDQIAEKLGIDKKYYQRMLVNQPQLLAENMNTWMHAEPEKRLLRMMSPLDDAEGGRLAWTGAQFRLRAYLSGSYRPMDNAQLVATVLPIAREKGAYLTDFSIDEQRMHAKFVTVERDVKLVVAQLAERMGLTYEEARSRHVIDQHEVLSLGVNIRNSETGFAALDVSGLIRILKCTNYYIAEQATRVAHLGRKNKGNGDGDLHWVSEQTQRLDNAAIFSRVKDTTLALLDETKQLENAEKIVKAKANIVEPEIPVFDFIDNFGEGYLQLTDGEAAVLKEEIVRSNMVEGAFSQFSLAQGVTATAKKVDSYDRRVELERAGWEIINTDTTRLLEAGRAAAKRKN